MEQRNDFVCCDAFLKVYTYYRGGSAPIFQASVGMHTGAFYILF